MPSDASLHASIENPWLKAFLDDPWEEIFLGQLSIRRQGTAFELRHTDDLAATNLKSIRLGDVRQLANFSADGKFRPLKSTPDLVSGWVLRAVTPEELETALQIFYPNALPDLHAARKGPPPATSYREFTNRQSGMYRITTFLKDNEAGRVIETVCNAICIKYRLWPIEGAPNPAGTNNLVCLEPCAIFLEAARKEVRALQEKSAKANPADSAPEAA